MQDTYTGAIVPFPPEIAEAMSKIPLLPTLHERLLEEQRLKDAVIPDRLRQGTVFSVGQEIEIQGGLFRVHAISGNRIYLDSIPARPRG